MAGIDSARSRCTLLLADAMGMTPDDLIAATRALGRRGRALRDCVARRAAREPLAYITGKRILEPGIQGRTGVLVPRPDTETLIEEALLGFRTAIVPCIADLGTGSGAC